LGAEPAAAIGLVEPATWLFFSLIGAVTMGFSVQAAHFIGAKDFSKARSVMRHGYAFGLCFALCFLLVTVLIAPYLPIWLRGGKDIQHDASTYFLIFSFIIPFHLLEVMSASMLKVSGDMRRPSLMAILMCVLDVIFNYFFIFPTHDITLLGLQVTVPGWGAGVAGAAFGSLLAFIAVALPLAYYAIFRSPILAWKLDVERFVWRWQYIWNAMKIGSPMALQYLLMNGAQLVSTMIVAPLGNVSIAAHSFAITAESLCYMPGYGIAAAATTLIGQAIGASKKDLAKDFANIITLLGMSVMGVIAIFLFFTSPIIFAILTPDVEVQRLGVSVIRVVMLAEPLFAASIVITGVLRGAGDTVVPFILNFLSLWGIRITLAFFLAPTMGLMGAWLAMTIDIAIRGVLYLIRLYRTNWLSGVGG